MLAGRDLCAEHRVNYLYSIDLLAVDADAPALLIGYRQEHYSILKGIDLTLYLCIGELGDLELLIGEVGISLLKECLVEGLDHNLEVSVIGIVLDV